MTSDRITIVNLKSAAFFSAALVVLLALGWILVARAQAQAPSQLQGQLFNGTRDAPAGSIAGVPVTLFQITAAGPVTQSMQTDAEGKFLFTNVTPDANTFFTRVDYAGIRYFSTIIPAEIAALSPITMTVYETRTIPANFTLERIHLILDVQPKMFNGLELVRLTNPGDRAFYLPLPLPENATDVQFQDVREQTIIKRQEGGTILYPILPTTTDILYGIVLPFTPPDYPLRVPFVTNVGGTSLLVSETAGIRVSGSTLVPGEPFRSETGQRYLVFSGSQQSAGSTFSATISNLPGADNTGTLQTVIVVGGGIGALALLAYPIYRRRVLRNKTGVVSERVTQLHALARLDDAFEREQLEEDEYQAQRAALKAELLNARPKERSGDERPAGTAEQETSSDQQTPPPGSQND